MIDKKNDRYAEAWDAEVDVLIAGAGAAGLAAAVEAAGAGAQTLVLEKQAKYWDCSTALSGGSVAFAGTDFQKRKGIHDSNDLLHKDLMEVGQWKNDEKLVQAYVRNQLDTYHWLMRLGVKWANVEAMAGMSAPRGHRLDPLELVKTLKQTAESKGATILFQTSLTGLVTDEGKRVIGITAEETTGTTRVRARRGVVLACGGFGWDPKRVNRIDPRFSKVLVASGRGNTGDGHKMAEKLGAYLKDVEYVKPSFGMHVTGTSAVENFHGYYFGAIIVNKKGERFVNESLSYKDIAMASLEQSDAIGYQIFDQKIYEAGVRAVETSEMPLPQHSKGLDQARINLLVKANTIEELASRINVPPETLKQTIDRYNTQADAGKDLDFGRTTLSGGVGRIARIDTPPFYTYETKAALVGTYGGIAIDEHMHVLTRQGKIPGLYAAGEIIGGFHGASYMSGTSVGKAIIFGRIAGRNAAKGL